MPTSVSCGFSATLARPDEQGIGHTAQGAGGYIHDPLNAMNRVWEDERRKLPRTLSSRLRPPIRTSNADIRRDVEDQVSTVVLPFQW